MKRNREIWHPPVYDEADARAMQALAQGKASSTQQQRALDWIIKKASATYDEPFRPGRPDLVSYMLGRRSVGLAIVKLLNLKIKEIFHNE